MHNTYPVDLHRPSGDEYIETAGVGENTYDVLRM